MIFEVLIFTGLCYFAFKDGYNSEAIKILKGRVSDLADKHRENRVDILIVKQQTGIVKTIQSKIDKLEDKIKKSEEAKTSGKCSSDDIPYNKSLGRKINDVELELETLYDYFGIKKEYFICPDCLGYARSIEDARDYKFVKDKK